MSDVIKEFEISGIRPDNGHIGEEVLIQGQCFTFPLGVMFAGGARGIPMEMSSESIRLLVPPGAKSGRVEVTIGDVVRGVEFSIR